MTVEFEPSEEPGLATVRPINAPTQGESLFDAGIVRAAVVAALTEHHYDLAQRSSTTLAHEVADIIIDHAAQIVADRLAS